MWNNTSALLLETSSSTLSLAVHCVSSFSASCILVGDLLLPIQHTDPVSVITQLVVEFISWQ